jgi:hypothetical protein
VISLQAMSVEHREPQPWSLPRAHPRFLLDLRLVVKTVKTKETQHGRTKDIAEGGLGATIPGEIALGEIVELELQLSGAAEPLKLKAEVRYRRGFQYGFKFLQATEQQKELIRRATQALPPAP